MKDYYQVLGVIDTAALPKIEREYQKRKQAIAADSSLSESQRKKSIVSLEEAHAVLSDPNSRAAHDAELAAAREAQSGGGSDSIFKRLALPLVAVLLLSSTGYGYWHMQEQKRIVMEERERERIAEVKRLADEAAEKARREAAALAEAEARRIAEEERLRLAQEQRESEMKNQQFVGLNTFVPRQKSQAELYEERRKQYQDAVDRTVKRWEDRIEQVTADRQAALAREETNRQKRFIEQSQREEELAARRRANAR